MDALNRELCWELLCRHYEQNRTAGWADEEDIRKKRAHAGRVFDICQEITAALPSACREHIDGERLVCAAILHDIAKFDSDETHHLLAAGTIQSEYEKWAVQQPQSPGDALDFSQIGGIIRWHKGDAFTPPGKLALEASILRMADKIDKVCRKTRKLQKEGGPKKLAKRRKELQKAKERYEESLAAVRPYWGNDYAAFQQLCAKELRER